MADGVDIVEVGGQPIGDHQKKPIKESGIQETISTKMHPDIKAWGDYLGKRDEEKGRK